jgi:hypothetical protein
MGSQTKMPAYHNSEYEASKCRKNASLLLLDCQINAAGSASSEQQSHHVRQSAGFLRPQPLPAVVTARTQVLHPAADTCTRKLLKATAAAGGIDDRRFLSGRPAPAWGRWHRALKVLSPRGAAAASAACSGGGEGVVADALLAGRQLDDLADGDGAALIAQREAAL